MLQSLYTTFQTSLLFNFQEVFLVFLVILGYLSSLFTLRCGNAKPDVTFPAKKIHLVKSARSHVKWFETLRFCISSVVKRGENTCAKRKPKECTAQQTFSKPVSSFCHLGGQETEQVDSRLTSRAPSRIYVK